MPELKGKRERLWRKYKSADGISKTEILAEINALTEDIDKIQAQKNACNRIIARYGEIKEEHRKETESKQKAHELIISNKLAKVRGRGD